MNINTNCSYVFIEVIKIKAFAGKEKEYLTQQLKENAKKAFSRSGIKKTSIEDLTAPIGIAKGSFYIFYNSKEELYFELLKEEIKNSIPLNNFTEQSAQITSKQMLHDFLQQAVSSMYSNPILKLMLIPEEYNIVYRRLSAEHENNQAIDIVAPLTSLIKKWQSEGIVVNKNAGLLANIIKCLFLLTTHRHEIGEDIFPDVMDYMVDIISDSLTSRLEGEV